MGKQLHWKKKVDNLLFPAESDRIFDAEELQEADKINQGSTCVGQHPSQN